ncbi:YlzJ-like family protein [Paenibacillus oenotherae]|uniref:YlzJ-like family protein n=1 Tax=Paenibacillus oenotherae TaxID=1435645 RepID=A0ABS7D011_9BACL|nr:YlzJ-like family protein [Paenibacillus oenotherae]MBW7473237.1 YlzJ-like family protein [Paenibacillus oenotherae]
MTLYTNIPLELVFDGIHEEREAYLDIVIGDVRMQVEMLTPGTGRIVRLMECPLDAYLRPELAPGTVIALGPAAAK